jgi:hypothetical protein
VSLAFLLAKKNEANGLMYELPTKKKRRRGAWAPPRCGYVRLSCCNSLGPALLGRQLISLWLAGKEDEVERGEEKRKSIRFSELSSCRPN